MGIIFIIATIIYIIHIWNSKCIIPFTVAQHKANGERIEASWANDPWAADIERIFGE